MRYWFNEGRNELFAMEIPPIDLKDCIEVAEADYNEYVALAKADAASKFVEDCDHAGIDVGPSPVRVTVEQGTPKTPALRSLHEAMSDLHEVGAVDGATMRDFDERCLAMAEAASKFVEDCDHAGIDVGPSPVRVTVEEAPPTQPVPETVDMEKLARVWRKMQDARDKLSHDFKLADLAIENQQDQVGAAMLAAMNAMKGTKLTTAAGVVEKKTSMKASGSDWGAIQRFIIKHSAWELLHKRLGTRFIEDWAKKHDGELPPGISVYTEFKVTVTKPGSKEPPKAEE